MNPVGETVFLPGSGFFSRKARDKHVSVSFRADFSAISKEKPPRLITPSAARAAHPLDLGGIPRFNSEKTLTPRVSRPNFGGLEEDSSLWNLPGRPCGRKEGVRAFDLGGGVVRYDRADGSKKITGLKLGGKSIVHERDGENRWWYYDTNKAGKEIADAALAGVRSGSPPLEACDLSFGGVSARFKQYRPGDNGCQLSLVHFRDGRGTFQIFSFHPLPHASLWNMAAVIAGSPRETYRDVKQIFVLDRLGEVKKSGGAVRAASGLAHYVNGQLFFKASDLQTFAKACLAMDHEAAHIVDRRAEEGTQISSMAVDREGKRIFGRAGLPDGAYVSEYATRNGIEDFAETHRYVLALRRYFNARHPGVEFLSIPAESLRRELDRRNLAASLQNKIEVIVETYRRMRG